MNKIMKTVWITIRDDAHPEWNEKFSNYEVSNDGRIRNKKSGKLRSSTICVSGYEKVSLPTGERTPDGKEKYSNRFMHQWVMLMHGRSKPNVKNIQIDHIDGDKHNNNITNLRWVTGSENMKNMVVNKRKKAKTPIKKTYIPIRVNTINSVKPGDTLWTINKSGQCSIYTCKTLGKKLNGNITSATFMNNINYDKVIIDKSTLSTTNWFLYDYTSECSSFIENLNS